MRYESIEHIIQDDIFLTLREFLPGRAVHVKLEGFNAGNSIKMKTALALINHAEQHTQLLAHRRLIESSSGNLGLAVSVIAAAHGYHFTCVVDLNTSLQNIKLMRALGTEVVVIERRDEQGGYLGNRLAYIRDTLARDADMVWLNQYQNPANPAIHDQMTARAILAEFGQVDYLFLGAGTTGTLMGCVRHFRRHAPATQIIAVDAVGSVTFGTPGGKRYLPGLGSSVMPHFFDAAQLDRLVQIPEAEAVAMCRELARRYGYLSGASSGTVLAAVRRLLPEIPAGATVVALSPDFGQPYLDTVYSDDWCQRTFDAGWQTLS
ncbi:2,3-diaminopropionate biosynthesis protein SbnA [Duganella violaceipulchra]|uniref:2,3-diaminopropionate biosynthesis protein SbnA n=1 Tax=Duganella violaceipulchra TaxID=2849652 RepID=A0AA41L1Y2_9BURK|nr:2,3-diaminopropionate biosynthesis protein SbnA [Duganella violaceicalia]MBV6325541.1 2,3-diaminopropionate biosynthesis protein SbnA [Duganella violaceicalia]MCP2012118.1 cysteine synthase A [Duganella violaceicalia]